MVVLLVLLVPIGILVFLPAMEWLEATLLGPARAGGGDPDGPGYPRAPGVRRLTRSSARRRPAYRSPAPASVRSSATAR
ncbi:hypothetical protein FB558_0391 [Pseudonocardia kunmingensis]|uniref:Uncharacterized protein n=1 Tax=Pseudonocardia kunmingensis TaxID=630975 RepID=A0A543DWD4_9PSEU|nr:hypothetical protein FB558_0391 [Pseudonocardia kunmingensis]